jgi:hypothetical protein
MGILTMPDAGWGFSVEGLVVGAIPRICLGSRIALRPEASALQRVISMLLLVGDRRSLRRWAASA